LDDLELLQGQILFEFRDISRVSEAITAKRMEIDPYYQRRNCSPLNAFFSYVGYRLRWYRRTFTRKGASSKCRVGKCVELISQVALRLLVGVIFRVSIRKKTSITIVIYVILFSLKLT